jgi:hypothetical protein
MLSPFHKDGEPEWFVFFILLPVIIALAIAYACGYEPPKREPIKLPTAQDVGKKTGEIGTDFGIGIVKGSWKKVKDSLKRE